MTSSIVTVDAINNSPEPEERTFIELRTDSSPRHPFSDFIMSQIKTEPTEDVHIPIIVHTSGSPEEPLDIRYTQEEPLDIRYTPFRATLTPLETYRQESNSSSPLIFTKMINLNSGGHCPSVLDVPSDHSPHGTVVEEDSSSPNTDPPDDYKNLNTINPTLFTIRPDQVKLVYRSRDVSSSSSSPSSTSWIPSQQEEDCYSQSNSIANGRSPVFDMISRECVNCGTMASGIWWPDDMGHYLCANCSRFRHSGVNLMDDTPKSKPSKRSTIKKTNQICSNCKTTHTSLWRRSPTGETVCNACGLYFKLHRSSRPITMRKDSIQKRKRKPKAKDDVKNMPTPPMTPRLSENGVHTIMETTHFPSTPSPTSCNSRDMMPNRNRLSDSNSSPLYSTAYQLPSVHSPDGFGHQLPNYGSPERPSTTAITNLPGYRTSPPPLLSSGSYYNLASSPSASIFSSVLQSYISPSMASTIPSPSPSPSPMITSLLSSPLHYQPFSEGLHHLNFLQSVEHSAIPAAYNS